MIRRYFLNMDEIGESSVVCKRSHCYQSFIAAELSLAFMRDLVLLINSRSDRPFLILTHITELAILALTSLLRLGRQANKREKNDNCRFAKMLPKIPLDQSNFSSSISLLSHKDILVICFRRFKIICL